MIQKLKVMVAAAALMMCTHYVIAQDCGCQNNVGYVQGGGCSSCGNTSGLNNCGRDITNAQAAALWANYCHEDCSYQGGSSGCGCGSGCGLFSRLRGRLHGGAGGCGASCCDPGGFGWPAACNDGCGTGCDSGVAGFGGGCKSGCGIGGLFAALKARHGGRCGGGCQLFGKFGGGCDGGCGGGCGLFTNGRIFGGLGLGHGGGCFSRIFAGKCGRRCGYFNEFVGADYGNCDFKSGVSGAITSQCGCDSPGATYMPTSVQDANSVLSAPAAQQQSDASNGGSIVAPGLELPPASKPDANANEIQGELIDN